jgi:hypothetical protein
LLIEPAAWLREAVAEWRKLADIAGEPEIFDLMFLNHQGEIAEGARSNPLHLPISAKIDAG